jgi:hypothetical protein
MIEAFIWGAVAASPDTVMLVGCAYDTQPPRLGAVAHGWRVI